MQNVRGRSFFATLYSIRGTELTDTFIMEPILPNGCNFFAGQLERCPTTGRLHLQCVIQYTHAVTYKRVLRDFEATGHLEQRKGTWDESIAYVTKEETRVSGPWEFGERPTPGKRSDLDSVIQTVISSGGSLRQVAENHPAAIIRYARGIQTLCSLHRAKRERITPTVTVYWGPPGTGKSHKALEEANALDVGEPYYKGPDKWWDYYDSERVVIFDDFYGAYPYHYLLNLLDKYQCKIEMKGAITECTANHFFFTSNAHPSEWYKEEVWKKPGMLTWSQSALARRITSIVQLTDVYKE
jgi:hypothetical protein